MVVLVEHSWLWIHRADRKIPPCQSQMPGLNTEIELVVHVSVLGLRRSRDIYAKQTVQFISNHNMEVLGYTSTFYIICAMQIILFNIHFITNSIPFKI